MNQLQSKNLNEGDQVVTLNYPLGVGRLATPPGTIGIIEYFSASKRSCRVNFPNSDSWMYFCDQLEKMTFVSMDDYE